MWIPLRSYCTISVLLLESLERTTDFKFRNIRSGMPLMNYNCQQQLHIYALALYQSNFLDHVSVVLTVE